MPLLLTCPCGQQLQVRDEFAGQMVRCPACGATLAAPSGDRPVQNPSPSSSPPPVAGRPSPGVQPPGEPPLPPVLDDEPRRRPRYDEDDEERRRRRRYDEDDEPRPPRRRRSSNAVYWIVGLLVAVAIVVPVACIGLLLPATQKVREAAARAQSQNNLHQIGLAFHWYHEMHGFMPAAAVRDPATGKPLHSWRVALLPFIEQDALYKAIKKDEPWDSPYNRQFWDQMPKTYALPGKESERGKTYYQVFTGPDTPFGSTPVNLPGSFKKGMFNTILVVEASTPVNWMAPDDIVFRPDPGGFDPKQLGGHFGKTVSVLLADGSVKTIPWTMSPKTVQAAITLNDDQLPTNDPEWGNK